MIRLWDNLLPDVVVADGVVKLYPVVFLACALDTVNKRPCFGPLAPWMLPTLFVFASGMVSRPVTTLPEPLLHFILFGFPETTFTPHKVFLWQGVVPPIPSLTSIFPAELFDIFFTACRTKTSYISCTAHSDQKYLLLRYSLGYIHTINLLPSLFYTSPLSEYADKLHLNLSTKHPPNQP